MVAPRRFFFFCFNAVCLILSFIWRLSWSQTCFSVNKPDFIFSKKLIIIIIIIIIIILPHIQFHGIFLILYIFLWLLHLFKASSSLSVHPLGQGSIYNLQLIVTPYLISCIPVWFANKDNFFPCKPESDSPCVLFLSDLLCCHTFHGTVCLYRSRSGVIQCLLAGVWTLSVHAVEPEQCIISFRRCSAWKGKMWLRRGGSRGGFSQRWTFPCFHHRNMQKRSICQQAVGQYHRAMQICPVQQAPDTILRTLWVLLSSWENPGRQRAGPELKRWARVWWVSLVTHIDAWTTLEYRPCLSCRCVCLLLAH